MGMKPRLGPRQRLDKWLWFARVTKTRGLAARLITGGHVRLNARRIETPAKAVSPGDVLTIALEHRVRVLKIVAAGTRRDGFSRAASLFEDLSPRQEM
jgi:ribosome-associated heat shock protein Hsp15